jgi:putative addiction module killer protein
VEGKIEIKFFKLSNGRSLVEEWIHSLDKNYKGRISHRFHRIMHGNIGDHKSVGEGIFELKFDFGSGYRVSFGKEENRIIILLYAGDKKTQKSDIKKAKKYWQEHQKDRE